MEEQLTLEFLRVVENGAIAAARTNGIRRPPQGGRSGLEAMRKTMDAVEMDGTIVIGEGNATKLPCFTSAKRWASPPTHPKRCSRKWTLPSIRLRAPIFAPRDRWRDRRAGASEKGGLLHAPDIYMEKIVWVRRARARSNSMLGGRHLKSIAKRLTRRRGPGHHRPGPPRHEKLTPDIR